jgi:polyribonucleotide 5'-hydroxyl-kinase
MGDGDMDFFAGVREHEADEGLKKTWSLKQENEFRFDVHKTENVTIKLLNGTAEMFGTELAREQEYVFSGVSGCICTYTFCDLEVMGRPAHAYVETDTTMRETCAIHSVLDARRQRALDNDTGGPRVVVVGPPDSGKSTISRILLAYATRLHWLPTLVDVDLGSGLIGVPGSIGATVVVRPNLINDEYSEDDSLQYFYGSMDPDHNPDLRKMLLTQLADAMDERMQSNARERASGCVVNTMGWRGEADSKYLVDVVETLKADVVIALNQRLFRDLQVTFSGNKEMDVVMLKSSGGITACTEDERLANLQRRARDYFYGFRRDLSPKRQVEGFVDLQIYQIGGGMAAPISALPIGEASTVDTMAITPAMKTKEALLYTLCAVSLATTLEDIKTAPVAGYILISEVDMAKQTITFLSPSMGLPAAGIIILGSMKWADI